MLKKVDIYDFDLVTDRSSVLPFCQNQTEQVNKSSVSQTETKQNRTCKKCKKKTLDLNRRRNKQTKKFKLISCEA